MRKENKYFLIPSINKMNSMAKGKPSLLVLCAGKNILILIMGRLQRLIRRNRL